MCTGLHAQRRDLRKTQAQLELLLNLFSVSLLSFTYIRLKEGCVLLPRYKGSATKQQLNLYIILMTYKPSKRKLSRMFDVTHNHLFHF